MWAKQKYSCAVDHLKAVLLSQNTGVKQAWWPHLHQVLNPRPRLHCWETAKTHGVRFFEALHQTSPVREQEQQVWERRRSQVELYITRLHDEVSISFHITQVKTFFRSLFSVIHGEWTSASISILRLVISDWTLGENHNSGWTQFAYLWIFKHKNGWKELNYTACPYMKNSTWLLKNVHNHHLKNIIIFQQFNVKFKR